MILNLGLEPKPGTFHYPVIRTVIRSGPEIERALALWPKCTHLLLTSPRARQYWEEISPLPWHVEVWAIGEATARGVQGAHLAPFPTQEGMVELLKQRSFQTGFCLLPHSGRSRPLLRSVLETRQIPHFAFALYDTEFYQPGPPPPLDEVEEILFTSPSTVDGFCAIYKTLPHSIRLTPIGPITAQKLSEILSQGYDRSC